MMIQMAHYMREEIDWFNNLLIEYVFLPALAVFEPGAKHTFDEAAGKNIANPTAALLASAKMLEVIIIYE